MSEEVQTGAFDNSRAQRAMFALPSNLRRSLPESVQAAQRAALEALQRLTRTVRFANGWYPTAILNKESLATCRAAGRAEGLGDLYSYQAQTASQHSQEVANAINFQSAYEYMVRGVHRERQSFEFDVLRGANWRLVRTNAHRRGRSKWRRSSEVDDLDRGPGSLPLLPDDCIPSGLEGLGRWMRGNDPRRRLVTIALAQAHWLRLRPFEDGNFRMGLLLVPLLLKKHALLDSPSLCFNTIVSKRSAEYRKCLTSALTRNDWNEWFEFFLRTIIEAAELAIDILQHLTELIEARRCRLLSYEKATISAMQLENLLRRKPVVTVATVTNELLFTDPTARGAIKVLCDLEILRKVTKGRRNRVFADVDYLTVLGAEEVRRSR